MQRPFVFVHAVLLKLYSSVADGHQQSDLSAELQRVRDVAGSSGCAETLVAYERYLDLIVLRLDASALKERLTLLDDPKFERALRHDPSQPFNLIGKALSHLRTGDNRRARQLLRRLAASRYAERALAQRILDRHLLRSLPT